MSERSRRLGRRDNNVARATDVGIRAGSCDFVAGRIKAESTCWDAVGDEAIELVVPNGAWD